MLIWYSISMNQQIMKLLGQLSKYATNRIIDEFIFCVRANFRLVCLTCVHVKLEMVGVRVTERGKDEWMSVVDKSKKKETSAKGRERLKKLKCNYQRRRNCVCGKRASSRDIPQPARVPTYGASLCPMLSNSHHIQQLIVWETRDEREPRRSPTLSFTRWLEHPKIRLHTCTTKRPHGLLSVLSIWINFRVGRIISQPESAVRPIQCHANTTQTLGHHSKTK